MESPLTCRQANDSYRDRGGNLSGARREAGFLLATEGAVALPVSCDWTALVAPTKLPTQ